MSYVEMEQKICPICGTVHSFNTGILLHTQLKDIKDTVTGYGLCEEHQELRDKGYIALIEVTNTKDPKTLNEADRTGRLVHLHQDAFAKIFDTPTESPFVFTDPEVMEKLITLKESVDEVLH